jgi:hypothetical protein
MSKMNLAAGNQLTLGCPGCMRCFFLQLATTGEKETSMARGTDRSSWGWGQQCTAAGYGEDEGRPEGKEQDHIRSAAGRSGSDETPEAYTSPCRGRRGEQLVKTLCATVGRGAAAGAATQQFLPAGLRFQTVGTIRGTHGTVWCTVPCTRTGREFRESCHRFVVLLLQYLRPVS